MMGANVLCAVFPSGRLSETAESAGKSKKAGQMDINGGRCMRPRLMSHEIHDAAALYQLPQVEAVCKHCGWMLIRFMA